MFYDDEEDDDYEDDSREWERACVDCGQPGIDQCGCCGGWLCGMHGEIGAGFCRNCPTQEWIDEQNGAPPSPTYHGPPVRAPRENDDDLPF